MAGTPQERPLRAVSPGDVPRLGADEHDSLTGLPNLAGARRRAGTSSGAVVLVGLDADHDDVVVAIVARRFAGVVRPTDVLGRIGEGSFVVFLPDADVYTATIVGGRFLDAVDEPIDVDGARVRVGASVGVDASPSRSLDDQLAAAATALERARDAGGNRVEVAKT